MKHMILMRHAEALPAEPGQPDHARVLSGRGEVDAALIARQMAGRWRYPDLVLASPAKRTRRTAEVVAAGLAYAPVDIRFEPRIYEARVGELHAVLQSLDSALERILVVAHNPAVTELATFLLQQRVEALPSGAYVELALELDDWKDLAPGCARLLGTEQPLR